MAKKITLIIFTLVFVVGCIGAFVPTFQMEGFIAFLKVFTPTFITLLTSIGASAITDKIKAEKTIPSNDNEDASIKRMENNV